MAMEGAESLGVSWSLCLANHATRKVSCLKATTTHISAFQHVLHASASWSGTRMELVDGMGSVRTCKRREGAGQGGSAGRKIHR